MGRSKLEEQLAGQLELASRDWDRARWPYPPPEREVHPFWCCEHRKRAHKPGQVQHAAAADGPWEDVPGWTVPTCAECVDVHEYRHDRDFRCDFVWPELRLVVEVEGVVYRPKDGDGVGRHQQAQGFEDDLDKYAALERAGYRVLRVGRRMIRSGAALALIQHALQEAVDKGVDKALATSS